MKKKELATRTATEDMTFGQPADLPLISLPTELDVGKCFMFQKQ